jgi:SPP1 gp7 family putative phage head morphogenesis protein
MAKKGPSIDALKRLPPAEAIRLAKERGVVLPDSYYAELPALARAMAFSIAGIAARDQLQAVLDSLVDTMQEGETFEVWRERVTGGGIGIALPDHRLRNIFRTNMVGQYMRGRCEGLKRRAKTHPYLKYTATQDGRTRPAHAAMHGFVAHREDNVWATWMPPCGYQCRCDVIALTEKQAARHLQRDEERLAKDREAGLARVQALAEGPDAGWDYSVCSEPTEGVRRAIEDALARWGTGITGTAEKITPAVVLPTIPPPHEFIDDLSDIDKVQALGDKALGDLLDGAVPEDYAHAPFRGVPLRDMLRGGNDERQHGAFILRKKIAEKLASVRSIGGTVPRIHGSAKAKAHFAEVGAVYPSSWIDRANAIGVTHVSMSKVTRGWQWFNEKWGPFPAKNISGWPGGKYLVDTGDSAIVTYRLETSIHEFAHRLQNVLPDVDAAFQAFHRRRTSGDPLRKLADLYPNYAYRPDEVTREDDYIDGYFGKEYGPRGALEMITMSFQLTLTPGVEGLKQFEQFAAKDEGLLAFTLGILMHYRP